MIVFGVLRAQVVRVAVLGLFDGMLRATHRPLHPALATADVILLPFTTHTPH